MDKTFLPVLKIQRFSLHDGPGVRTTVFTKGCPLNCKWCHNPESKSLKRQFFYTSSLCIGCGACVSVCKENAHKIENGSKIFDRKRCTECMQCVNLCPTGAIEECSKELSVAEIISAVKKDVAFYGKKGGITLSGGEPFMHGEKAIALIARAKEQGLNVAVQTCGFFDKKLIDKMKGLVDLVLFDVKDTSNERHIKNTGVGTEKIIENLFALDSAGINTVLRCIIVKGENDNAEHFDNVISFYNKLKNCKGLEIFAHHTLGESKYLSLGLEYSGKADWSPDKKQLLEIKKYFNDKKVKCKIIE